MAIYFKFRNCLANLCLFYSNVHFFYITWWETLVCMKHYFGRNEKQATQTIQFKVEINSSNCSIREI